MQPTAAAGVALAVILLAVLPAARAAPEGRSTRSRFHFGLIGDQRHTADQRTKFPNLVDDMNRTDLAFTVHDGGIGLDPAACTDDYHLESRSLFEHFSAPLIYTPGENEWADCGRGGYDPLERLAALRHRFFGSSQFARRRTDALTRQSPAYPENARWDYGPVTFATLHVVGSDDAAAAGGFAARRAANHEWLARTFDHATRHNRAAIVVIWHADPRFGEDAAPYNDLRGALRAETLRFGKPVVLVHGGGAGFRVDKPMKDHRGHRVENFTRVQTFGPTEVHWVKGSFDQTYSGLFAFRPQVVAVNSRPR